MTPSVPVLDWDARHRPPRNFAETGLFERRIGARSVRCAARAVVVSFLVLTIRSVAHADDWQTYQHDTAHTGRSTASFDPRTLSFAWKAPDGYNAPLIVGENVIALNGAGSSSEPDYITSFALGDGSINWTYSGDYFSLSPPTSANGLVLYTAVDRNFDDRLYVHNGANGSLKYSVPIDDASRSPLIVGPAVSGSTNRVAYVASSNTISAIRLGTTSGTVLWSERGSFGGSSAPTLAGNSVIVAGPGQYYAFDRSTGEMNHFHQGNVSGGGGTTAAYDASRKNIYIVESYDVQNFALTAYRYVNNNSITQLWQRADLWAFGAAASVAIGADGKVYVADRDRLLELSPTNGATLRSLAGQDFAAGVTPIVQDGYVWAFSDDQTLAYDLSTFTLARALGGSRGSLNSALNAPGAIADEHFIVGYGLVYGEPGFDVYRAASPPAMGDANGDGIADLRDLAVLVGGFGRSTAATWEQGDFSGDGRLSIVDAILLRNQLGSAAASAGAGSADTAAVPEGASASLLAMALATLCVGRISTCSAAACRRNAANGD